VHGWLVIDKPVGPGSTDIVSKVKRALREGGYPKLKVGHAGTLDPLASGVLPVALGEATKLAGRMLDADKIYEFTIRFGEETDTLDAEGAVVERKDARPTATALYPALSRFVGTIEQMPPAFSALKVDGRRAYDLAREGKAVALSPRPVTIRELQAPAVDNWFTPLEEVTLTARVSKGTYIRSLARDIAYALDTVGHVTLLRRLKAGPFTLDSAISLDKMGELAKARQLEQALLPLAAGLDDIPALPVTPGQAGLLRQGRKLAGIAAKPGLHLATELSVPVALVELSEGELRVVRGFNI
jgi:tRNA pseudouridine55 synthase